MGDPFRVSGFQGSCDLHARAERFVKRQRAAPQSVRECFALDEFKRQETTLSRLANVVDGGDVRMIQRCQDFGFPAKSRKPFRIPRKDFGQYFDGDVAFEDQIAGAIDLPHASGAEKTDDLVSAYVLAWLKCHVAELQAFTVRPAAGMPQR